MKNINLKSQNLVFKKRKKKVAGGSFVVDMTSMTVTD
jgi:hypothetical protein